MMTQELPSIAEQRRLASPAITPQALAWHGDSLWMGSRDLRRIYAIDPKKWTVAEEREAPGIPWAAVTLLRENLKLTFEQRARKHLRVLQMVEELRRAGKKLRQKSDGR